MARKSRRVNGNKSSIDIGSTKTTETKLVVETPESYSADTSEIVAEYALGGLENQIFASKYVYYIPNKDELIKQVQDAINDLGEKKEIN